MVVYSATVPSASASPSSSATPSPSLSQTLSGASTTSFGSPSTGTGSASQSNKLSTAAIAGVAAGCVLAVLIILFITLWITRRRLQRRILRMPARPEPCMHLRLLPQDFSDDFHAPLVIERGSARAPGPPTKFAGSLTRQREMTDTTTLSSVAASGPPHRDNYLYEVIGWRIHERDAGPAIEPPVYDPTWAVHM